MTQWEQMKKEYREIPVPEDGQYQMLQTIAKAKQKRDENRGRWMRAVKYASATAAAFLVILVMPMVLMFSRGFGSSAPESAPMEQECVTESAVSDDCFWEEEISEAGSDMDSGGMAMAEKAPASGMNDYKESADSVEECMPEEEAWNREAASKEIIRQMEERMRIDGELYYIKSEEYPDGFELLEEDQENYINEEGLLVIVFEAGTVAPKEQGVIEFVIPAEIVSP